MFKTYKASAGSGKTTNLVAEYLSLCFSNPHKYRNILAVTFTNNATAQMKQRIISTLQNFIFETDYNNLQASDKAILKLISKNLRLAHGQNEDFFRQKSKELLQLILYDYPNFSISTIDSFFQRLLRSFALDLKLNLNYNLEIQLDDFFTQTIDILMNKISRNSKKYHDSGLTDRVLYLMENKMDISGRSNIEEELRKVLFSIYDENSYLPLKELNKLEEEEFLQKCKIHKKITAKFRNDVVNLAFEGDYIIKSSSIPESDFYQGNRGPYSWFLNLAINPDSTSQGYMQKAIERESFTKNKGELPDDVHQQLVELYYKTVEARDRYIYASILSQNIESLMLIFDLKKIMDDIKLRDNIFYLSETNAKIYDEIKDEQAPYIYEKLGNRYSYFLIDEFQDTSHLQWRDIFPLLKNALSGSNQYHEEGKTVIFGDVKQAIYRFRNGDATLLDKLSSFEGYQNEFGFLEKDDSRFELISLQTNYRSNYNIVDFNNHFFTYLKQITNRELPVFPMAERLYDDVIQEIKPTAKSGFVSIQFNSGESDKYEEEKVLEAVRDALSRDYDYQDIAVLTKDRERGVRLGQMLSENNIPVISSDTLLLGNSDKVNLIIATLKYLSNRDDKLSKLFIVNYLIKLKNSSNNLEDIYSYLENEDSFARFLLFFNITIQKERLLTFPLFTLIKEIIILYDFLESDLFVVGLLDVVFEYTSKNNSDLTQFLNWWGMQEGKLSITSPNKNNAVTVTTIHKAKGLEYPVVIIPINQYKEKSNNKLFWYKNETDESGLTYVPISISKKLCGTSLEELYDNESALASLDNLNVLYVAHTRPHDCMYIITGKKDRGNYSKYLFDFCDKNRDNPLFHFEEDNRIIYGDLDYCKISEEKDKKKDKMQSEHGISGMHTSSFTPESKQLAYQLFSSPSTKEKEIGLFVHNFLSSLSKFPQTFQEIEEMDLAMDEEKRSMVKGALKKIIADETLKPYFFTEAEVLNEISILKTDGSVRRPDRIVIMPEEVMVIDYKTGKENPKYEEQLEEYKSLLIDMGYKNVQGRLVFV